MPSRPLNDSMRTLTAKGEAGGKRVAIDLTQRSGARAATGAVTIEGMEQIGTFGVLQTARGWASFTAIDGAGRALTVIVDEQDPANSGSATLAINADGAPLVRGSLPLAAVAITTR